MCKEIQANKHSCIVTMKDLVEEFPNGYEG